MVGHRQAWRNEECRKSVLSIMADKPEILFFDTETTGLSADKDRIIEIGAIKIRFDEHNRMVEGERFHLYIRPPFMLPSIITELTGITDEQLADKPYEDECFDKVYSFFGNGPVVLGAHNASFDIRMLNALYKRNGRDPIICKQIDTLEMSRDILCHNETENHKLGTLAKLYGLDEGVSFHSAMDDITVTVRLFEVLYKEYLELEAAAPTGRIMARPKINTIEFWPGYRGFSRIYVNTSAGSVYYDLRRKNWGAKDMDLDMIDMSYIETTCLRATDSFDLEQFAKFKGSIKL